MEFIQWNVLLQEHKAEAAAPKDKKDKGEYYSN